MSHQEKVIEFKQHRFLVASFSRAKRQTRRWLVFLPESASDFRLGDRGELVDLIGATLSQKFNFLVINKSGLGHEVEDKEVFERSFRREKRIQDALQTMKEIVPRGDQIHLVGYSEGAYLAPQIARLDKRVKSVAMIGGGTRGWLKEELSNATPKEKPFYEKKIQEILMNPSSQKRWNGFSHATWHSYRGDHTLHALRGSKLPTLAILGARDRVIDLKATIVDLMLVSENKPIQIHIFGDCGHNFTRHWVPVSKVLGRFLSEQLK
jgi:pimeloyl-ACP methyl ester carboxylesterase